MNQFNWIASRFKSLALAFLAAGAAGLSHADEAQTETVTAEGVGKTEASAKKAAFKDAIQKVVGVLVDSSTQVKNEEIIKDELLEYSGGFISKSEVLSSKKDDEGLVRVKVKCVVEKTQVKKKLENLSVISIKVDGANLALKETSQGELRKDAAKFISKAIDERKKCFKAGLPNGIGDLKKNEKGEVYVPVSVYLDPQENKKWLDNWLPVFSKMAESQVVGMSQYQNRSSDLIDIGNQVRSKAMMKNPNRKESFFILVAESISSDLRVKWRGFKMQCDLTEIQGMSFERSNHGEGELTIKSSPVCKVMIELLDEKGSVVSCAESKGPKCYQNGGSHKITPIGISNESQAIEFAPIVTYINGGSAPYPKSVVCNFCFNLSKEELSRIRTARASLEWEDNASFLN